MSTQETLPELLPSNPVPIIRELAPFTPTTILFSPLLLGVGSVYLSAINWTRYGKPRYFWSTLLIGPVVVLLLPMLFALVINNASLAELLLNPVTGWVMALFFSVFINMQQAPHWRAWMDAHENTRPTLKRTGGWRPYIVSTVFTFVVTGVYAFVIIPILFVLLSSLQ